MTTSYPSVLHCIGEQPLRYGASKVSFPGFGQRVCFVGLLCNDQLCYTWMISGSKKKCCPRFSCRCILLYITKALPDELLSSPTLEDMILLPVIVARRKECKSVYKRVGRACNFLFSL